MSALKVVLALVAFCALLFPAGDANATRIRLMQFGPWGMLCSGPRADYHWATCTIRYQTGEHDVQWEVALRHEGARIVTWGLNKATCRQAEVSEAVSRSYGLTRPTLEASDIEEFARRTLEVIRFHVDFFGDCHNHYLRLYTPISPSVLDAAEPDFVRAFAAAEERLRQFELQVEANAADPRPELALQRRATLDRIATECGLPASIFVVAAADDVRFRPSPDMPYESLDCALRKLRTSDISLNSMGFVGNEAVEVESLDTSTASSHQPVVGWTVYAPARTEDGSFARFIVSGLADAVDEFTRESETEGWVLEARASATASLVFAQYRVPTEPVRTTSFMDRYLVENPRRLNIAGVVAKADAQ